MALERMGLRVIKDTLEDDFDPSEGYVVDVRGEVVIEITKDCILQDEIIMAVAPLLAAESLEGSGKVSASVMVHDWIATRNGQAVTCRVVSMIDTEPGTHFARTWANPHYQPRTGLDRAFWLLLIVPSLLLFW